MVLFGGYASGGYLSDVWEYDGLSWKEITPTDPEGDGNPSARHSHSLTYDAGRDVVVLFGGYASGGYLSDVWEYDGLSWKEITPTDPEGDGNRQRAPSTATSTTPYGEQWFCWGDLVVGAACRTSGNTTASVGKKSPPPTPRATVTRQRAMATASLTMRPAALWFCLGVRMKIPISYPTPGNMRDPLVAYLYL